MDDQTSLKTRRAALLAAGFAALAPLGLSRAMAQDKLAPAMVMYQANPKDGQNCAGCLHWQAPNACAIVSGVISPQGWCAVWAAKPT